MSKIRLIIEREYLTRVRKKSFIIMSILGPLLIAALYIIPIALSMMDNKEYHHIGILDTNGELKEALNDTESIHYEFIKNQPLDSIKQDLFAGHYSAILYRSQNKKYDEKGLILLSTEQPSIDLKQQISKSLEKNIKSHKMRSLGINKSALDSLHTKVTLATKKLANSGNETFSSPELAGAVGFIAALSIYFIIFLYGTQVMRGVIEEKTNRIIEVIISSVKPFELMMGKIVGIALVVLTQMFIWLLLSIGIFFIAGQFINSDTTSMRNGNQEIAQLTKSPVPEGSTIDLFNNFFEKLDNINPITIVLSYIFYLLGGYLLYASLFAAIGAAVDNETDSQQFILPVSLPMVLSFVVAINTATQPHSSIAFWMSIIPFTSPITMMVRLPHGIPTWELALSMILLACTFVFTTFVASKVYRIGILMYGKKPTYKEIWKWLKY